MQNANVRMGTDRFTATPVARPQTAPLAAAPQAPAAAPKPDTTGADQRVTRTFEDVMGRKPTAAELASWRGRDDKALRGALVDTPEFEARVRQNWENAKNQGTSKYNVSLDASSMRAIKAEVLKGRSTFDSVGLSYTGLYYTSILMGAYLRSVEKESEERRARVRA